jgi:hypothetical protein
MPPLFAEAAPNQPLASELHIRLQIALQELWPLGRPGSELLYTPYWSNVGFTLPEFVASILGFPVAINRCEYQGKVGLW